MRSSLAATCPGQYNDRDGFPNDRTEAVLDRVASHLAQAIRTHRSQRHWSIDDLVIASGVSKGAIVAIENGTTNPTLGTVVRLADALGLTVTDLLEPERQDVVTVVPHAGRTPLWQGSGGSAATLLLTVPGRTAVEVWRWTLAPGERYEGHAHPAGTAETVTVLTGALALTVDGSTVEVPADATATFAADRAHAYTAGPDGCTFLMTVHLPHSR
ncbi:MAG: helix-turn-helix domain-containing protein [Thermomicrobiales bacterium]